MKRSIVLLLTGLLLTACSSPPPVGPGAARSAAQKQAGASEKKRRGDDRKPGRGAPALTPMPGAPGGVAPVAEGRTTKQAVPRSRVGERFRFESARVAEPEPDAYKQGVTPDYAEILLVEIEGLGEDISFRVTFNGELPNRMTDDKTFMMVGWSVTGRDDDDGYGFGARATTTGWETYAGSKQEAEPFPGTFEIDGNLMTFTLPWKYLRGPRSFGWFATSAWVQNIGGVASYSSDPVPNGHLGRFPN